MRLLFIALTTAAFIFPADPALTVYNQNFAIVRENIKLDLKPGANPIEFAGVTSQLEPEAVLLRDRNADQNILILELSARATSRNECVDVSSAPSRLLRNRSMPSHPRQSTRSMASCGFELPGSPLFPSLGENPQLKPTLNWLLQSDSAKSLDAELSYSSGGLHWCAD